MVRTIRRQSAAVLGTAFALVVLVLNVTPRATTPLLAQEPNWVLKSPTASPSPRVGHAMAYDAARGQVVLFGGFFGTRLSDTWIWDGATWAERVPDNSPGPRSDFAMAYDAARGQVVLFGGSNGNNLLNDTWTWDGTTWTDRTSAASRPPARFLHSMAYDEAHGNVVLFGGGGPGNDTWTWDGTEWTLRSAEHSPPPRAAFGMAFDAARGDVVLFGGSLSSGGTANDTWVWDGTDWKERFPAVSPAPHFYPAMAYDTAGGQVVLFGGIGSSCCLNDTWTWDGTTWAQASPANSPTPRYYHAVAYDAARGQIVLFGGWNVGLSYQGDTWVWPGDPASPSRIMFRDLLPTPGTLKQQNYDVLPFLSAKGLLVKWENRGTLSDEEGVVSWLASFGVDPIEHGAVIVSTMPIEEVKIYVNGFDATPYALVEPFGCVLGGDCSARVRLKHYWFNKSVTVTVEATDAVGYKDRRSWNFLVETRLFRRGDLIGIVGEIIDAGYRTTIGLVIDVLETLFHPRYAY